MQIDIRLANTLDHPSLRQTIERRARTTLSRLSPRLSSVTVSMSPRTLREGGEASCRVSGELRRGGALHVTGIDARPDRALDEALRRLRRTVRRRLDRRSRAANRNTRRFTAE